jgi:2-dehydropantoate 2-reductase
MRYVIIGAGAVGGTIGARLFQRGHDVVLVARGEHLAALRRDGLRFSAPGEDARLPVPVVGGPAELALTPDDVVVLAVKTQHSAAALADWASAPVAGAGTAGRAVQGDRTAGRAAVSVVGRTAGEGLPVVCAQNGVVNEGWALRWFRRVVGMCVSVPATHLEPGVVRAGGAPLTGIVHLGGYPGATAAGTDPRGTAAGAAHAGGTDPGAAHAGGTDAGAAHAGAAEAGGTDPGGTDSVVLGMVGDLNRAGFRAVGVPDVARWKHAKLLRNLANAVEAVCGELVGSAAERLVGLLRAEGEAVFAAAGIAWASDAEWAALPHELVRVRRPDQPWTGGGSSWQSLVRGAGSLETDYLNGEIVRLGRAHRVPTPANELVQRVANEWARASRPPGGITPDDLLAVLEPLVSPAPVAGRCAG